MAESKKQLYMLIDVTNRPVGVKVLATGDVHQIPLLGKLAKAEGKEVVGPVLEGRSLSKFSVEELQYLLWNTFAVAPGNEYAQLIIDVLYHVNMMNPDTTDVRDLEAACARIAPVQIAFDAGSTSLQHSDSDLVTTPTPKKGRGKKAAAEAQPAVEKPVKKEKTVTEKAPKSADGRPSPTSLTGVVWVISDECLAAYVKEHRVPKGGEIDWKAVRSLVSAACEEQGIKSGTVSVQYGKWKKAQNA